MRKRFKIASLIGVAAALTAAAVVPFAAFSADHLDAPAIDEDPAADLADVYAFRSPASPDNLVVALTVNPFSIPGNAARNFSADVLYQIHVAKGDDLSQESTVNITFSPPTPGKPQTFTVTGLGAQPITGQTTPPTAGKAPIDPVVTTAGPIKIFAGPRDDPFFFDVVGFNRFLANPGLPAKGLRPAGENPVDGFAGFNVSAIVIELPITALTGASNSNTGVIKAWVSTARRASTLRGATGDTSSGDFVQVDREGVPAVNTALIPGPMKDAYNRAHPKNDVRDYRAIVQGTIDALRNAVKSIPGFPPEDSPGVPSSVLAQVVEPDIVTIDFSKPVQFPNGRRLQDDVMDAVLGLVLNRGNVLGGGPGVSDGVNANDRPFLATFPYLAAPNQPVDQTSSASAEAVALGSVAAQARESRFGLDANGSALVTRTRFVTGKPAVLSPVTWDSFKSISASQSFWWVEVQWRQASGPITRTVAVASEGAPGPVWNGSLIEVIGG